MIYRLCTFFIISIIIAVPLYLSAQTADELQQNLNNLSSQIQALDKEIAEFNKKINQTQGEAKTLRAALASLELRRSALEKEINRTRLQIGQTEIKITDTQGKIVITESSLVKNKNALSETLRTLDQSEHTLPPLLDALSSGGRLSDVFEAVKRGNDISQAINEKVATLSESRVALATQKAVFESNKQQLEQLNSTLADQKKLVEVTTKDKNTLLVETKNKESEYQRLVAERKKKKENLEVEMLDVEARLRVVVDVTKIPKYGKGILKYPVANPVITQYFGNTPFASQNPQVYNGSGHNGVDFGIKSGTPLLAAAAGTIVGTGDTDLACSGVSYGKWVLIRHTNGLSTLYAHMSVISVQAGQTVTTGQKIGLSGNTGYSTGPHLHFTVYASDAVHIAGPTEYKSKVCGTYMILPLAPRDGYLNPLSYF